ncbi:MAG TPA: sulfite exporter TauE/SafE family protein [Bacteroidota bacterium]
MALAYPWEIVPFFFLVAFLYSSVGHGGASGYLALFALFGVASPAMAPVALVLNILVASTSCWHYYRGGHFSWKMLWPFVVSSLPAAFLGGFIAVSPEVFSVLLGVALLLAAGRIFLWNNPLEAGTLHNTPLRASIPIGGVLGFVSGMIGIGGGVFLSPILLLFRWADVKRTAAISSAFIVLNSMSGLAGHLSRSSFDVPGAVPLIVAAVTGAFLGSRIGAFKLSARILQGVLGLVLVMAGAKLIGKVFWMG